MEVILSPRGNEASNVYNGRRVVCIEYGTDPRYAQPRVEQPLMN